MIMSRILLEAGGKAPVEVEGQNILKGAERKIKYTPAAVESYTEEVAVAEEPVEQIYGETEVIAEDTSDKIECQACKKTFSTKSSLKRHEERSPLCVKWRPYQYLPTKLIRGNIIDLLENIKKTTLSATDNELQCKYCSTIFSTSGNLNKHFKTAIMCNQHAMVSFLQQAKMLSK
jgi:uncharacterized Zn-finger protein